MNCDALNAGLNLGEIAGSSIKEHLHMHVVPRWQGDNNFMPVVADVRVMPQALEETYSYLAPAFAE
jgi:ATP adenylyltransferase